MFPFAIARRHASPLRLSLTSLRRASTKSTAKTQIKKAILDPAPPVLARYPHVYRLLLIFKTFMGLALTAHIFIEYFYSLNLAEGISMLPTMNAEGDFLLMSKKYRRGRDVNVGDIVSFKHPIDQDTYGVKRVIGMPGDLVLRDSPDTSGLMIQIPEGHCYVVGDNLTFSRDSRMFGPLPLGLVKAKVIGRFSWSEFKWTSHRHEGLRPAQNIDSVD